VPQINQSGNLPIIAKYQVQQPSTEYCVESESFIKKASVVVTEIFKIRDRKGREISIPVNIELERTKSKDDSYIKS